MGEVVFLSRVQEDRSRPVHGDAAFFFALDCPLSYLAAERVERALGEIEWIPVLTHGFDGGPSDAESERVRSARRRLAIAEHEARTLNLPLVEPHHYPFEARRIARAAALAAERGVGSRFALAALRLAFCGGYDLSYPEVIGEAAAVAGLRVGEAIVAASAREYDLRLEATSRGLFTRGISAPAIRIGQRWFEGVDVVSHASMFKRTDVDGEAPPLHAG
jgi:2-hydroxychromene-2-carboxylate isomerase